MTDQYDRYVRGNSVLAQPEDAGMLRIDEETNLGIALATDGNGRFCLLDPYTGAQLALAEAYRNVAVSGAEPLAITDCLNFGSPEDPAIMWQFSEAVRGLVDGCRALGIPVTGGNVSFYNQTGDAAILPTPIVGVLGVIEDVTRRTPVGFRSPGDVVYLLGETHDELAGSAWAETIHDHLGGRPPMVDFAARAATRPAAGPGQPARGAEQCARPRRRRAGPGPGRVLPPPRTTGSRSSLPNDLDPFVALFSESSGRVLVSVKPDAVDDLTALCDEIGVERHRLGTVGEAGAEAALSVTGQFSLPLAELREAWSGTAPRGLRRLIRRKHLSEPS